jgi:hypothetical protein
LRPRLDLGVRSLSGSAYKGLSCNDGQVAPVERLVTFVDVDDDVADTRQISVSARHEAVLADGRHMLLLNGRGWRASGPPDIWARTSVEDIVDTTRTVVGPDEPFGGRSREDMAADHWAHLTEVLRQQGVVADPRELRALPHDVVLSGRLLARVGHNPSSGARP